MVVYLLKVLFFVTINLLLLKGHVIYISVPFNLSVSNKVHNIIGI